MEKFVSKIMKHSVEEFEMLDLNSFVLVIIVFPGSL